MAVNIAELAKALSKETIVSGMHQQWDRAKLASSAGIPLADRTTANSETKLTETGRWLLTTLETMTGNAYWEVSAEQYENRITVYNPASKLRFSIGRQELDERDPVTLLDCFTCAACGADTSKLDYVSRWRIAPGVDMRSRSVCESCGDSYRRSPRSAHQIECRNQRLGIKPQAILWQRGSHGVRLEKAMATVNYDININTDGEPFDAKAMAKAMRDAFAVHADKQAVMVLAPPNDAHREAIAYADREITKAIIGVSIDGGRTLGPVKMVEPSPEQSVKPCDWCGDAYATSANGTYAHVRECVPLEKLYRERLAAGGADCPEAREEVRRFKRRQAQDLDAIGAAHVGYRTNCDSKGEIANKARFGAGKLDKRIAAAQSDEKPRHASDWDCWSTFSDES